MADEQKCGRTTQKAGGVVISEYTSATDMCSVFDLQVAPAVEADELIGRGTTGVPMAVGNCMAWDRMKSVTRDGKEAESGCRGNVTEEAESDSSEYEPVQSWAVCRGASVHDEHAERNGQGGSDDENGDEEYDPRAQWGDASKWLQAPCVGESHGVAEGAERGSAMSTDSMSGERAANEGAAVVQGLEQVVQYGTPSYMSDSEAHEVSTAVINDNASGGGNLADSLIETWTECNDHEAFHRLPTGSSIGDLCRMDVSINDDVVRWVLYRMQSMGINAGVLILQPVQTLALAHVGSQQMQVPAPVADVIAESEELVMVLGDSNADEQGVKHYCALQILRATSTANSYDSARGGWSLAAISSICTSVALIWHLADGIAHDCQHVDLQYGANCSMHALLAVWCVLLRSDPRVCVTASDAVSLRRFLAATLSSAGNSDMKERAVVKWLWEWQDSARKWQSTREGDVGMPEENTGAPEASYRKRECDAVQLHEEKRRKLQHARCSAEALWERWCSSLDEGSVAKQGGKVTGSHGVVEIPDFIAAGMQDLGGVSAAIDVDSLWELCEKIEPSSEVQGTILDQVCEIWAAILHKLVNIPPAHPPRELCRTVGNQQTHIQDEILQWLIAWMIHVEGGQAEESLTLSPILALVLARAGIGEAWFPPGSLPELEQAQRVYAIIGDNITERAVRHYCAVVVCRAEWKVTIYDSIDPDICRSAVIGFCGALRRIWNEERELMPMAGVMQQQVGANCGLHAALAVACCRLGRDPRIVSAQDASQLRMTLAVALNAVGDTAELRKWLSAWCGRIKDVRDKAGQSGGEGDACAVEVEAYTNADAASAAGVLEQLEDSTGYEHDKSTCGSNEDGDSGMDASEFLARVLENKQTAVDSCEELSTAASAVSGSTNARRDSAKQKRSVVVRRVNEKAIYLYHLPMPTSEVEIADTVYRFGNIVKIGLKRNSSAVVEFDGFRGAELALKAAEECPFIIRGVQISCRKSTTRAIQVTQDQPKKESEKHSECSANSSSERELSASDASTGSAGEDELPLGQWAQEWGDNGVITLQGDGYAEAVKEMLKHDRRLRRTKQLAEDGQFIGTAMRTKPAEAMRIVQLNGVGGCGQWDAAAYGKMCGEYLRKWNVQFAGLAEAGYLVRDSHKRRFIQGLQEYGYTAIMWGLASRSAGRGVGVVYESHIALGKQKRDRCGRAIAVGVKVLCGSKPVEVRLLCVYCPTNGTSMSAAHNSRFVSAETELAEFTENVIEEARKKDEVVIAMGDFNAVDDECLDAVGTAAVGRDESVLRRSLALGLFDTFRVLYPSSPASTRDTADGGNRLDYILLSPNRRLLPCGAAVHVDAEFVSDHKPVFLDLLGTKIAEAPAFEIKGQLKWQEFVRKGAEAELARDGGVQLDDFKSTVQENCPITSGELGRIEEAAKQMCVTGERSNAVRNEIGRMTMMVQQAVTETMRRTCGRTTGRGRKMERNLPALWYSVLNCTKIVRTVIKWMVAKRWAAPNVSSFQEKDKALRHAYDIACTAQEQDDSGFTRVDIPLFPTSVPAQREWWLESYMQCVYGKQNSVKHQALHCRLQKVVSCVQNARDERRNLLHQGKLNQFLRRMDPKCKSSAGYKPDFVKKEDGTLKQPESTEEWLKAADQAHEKILAAECKWKCPRYIRTWIDEVGCQRGDLVDDTALTEEENTYRMAFYNTRAGVVNFSEVCGPLGYEEMQAVLHRMAGKQPGLSKFKIAAVRFFSQDLQNAIHALINAQIALALIPDENKHVVVVHIEKASGGTRPLSLFEELTKVVEGIVAARIDAAARGAGLGAVLSTSNHAYQIGRGTYQPLTLDALVREDARANRKPLVRVQGDYDSWFDVVVRPVADADMGAKGYPERARQLFADLYTCQRCHVVTPFGLSYGVSKGSIGVGQGAISSPRLSLHAQDAATRLIDGYVTTHGYQMEKGCRVLQANYSDDWLWFVRDSDSAHELLRIAGAAWQEYGISNKPEKMSVLCYPAIKTPVVRSATAGVSAMDADGVEEAKPLVAPVWSWRSGEMQEVEINSLAHTDRYKQLGVTATWSRGSVPYGKAVLLRTWLAVSHMQSKKPQYDEVASYVKTMVVSGMNYAPLAAQVSPRQWHMIDIRIANGVRRSLGAVTSTTRQSMYCETGSGGLGLPSIVAERLASCARELQVELMGGEELATAAARDRWDQLRELSPKKILSGSSRYTNVVNYLAGYRFYFRDAQEKDLSRVLDEMADVDQSSRQEITEGFDGKSYRHWQKYSSLSPMAAWLRSKWQEYKASVMDTDTFWEEAVKDTEYCPDQIAVACKAAHATAERDITAECAMSNRPRIGLDSLVSEDYDAVTNDCPLTRYLDDHPRSDLDAVWIGTDGSGLPGRDGGVTVGAGVSYMRHVESAPGVIDWEKPGKIARQDVLRMARMYGTKEQTVRDAELRAVLTGLASAQVGKCPLVMDAQTEWKKVTGMAEWPPRRLCQGSNIPVENRLWRKLAQPRVILPDEQWITDVEAWRNGNVISSRRRICGRVAVWIRSHQEDPGDPNKFVVGLNASADKLADRAANLGPIANVKVPAGMPRFYFTFERAAVVGNIGKFIRRFACSNSYELWKKRPRQGALARVAPQLAKRSLILRRYKEVCIPPEVAQFWLDVNTDYARLEALVWKLWHYVDGSYTQMLHRDPELQENVRSLLRVEVGSDEIRRCQLCIDPKNAEQGTFRHLVQSCTAEEMVVLRVKLWDVVEKFLKDAVEDNVVPCTHQQKHCWCVSTWMRRNKCRRPGIWQVPKKMVDRWPVLAHLGWLLPFNECKLVAEPLEEGVYDLGYRALVPQAVACQLYRKGLEPDDSVSKDAIMENTKTLTILIAVMVGAMRRKGTEMVRDKFPKVSEEMQTQTGFGGEDAGSSMQKECKGEKCSRRFTRHGQLPNRAVVGTRCRGCRNAELKAQVTADVSVMLRARERKCRFVQQVASIGEIRAEYMKYKDTAQVSMENLCYALKANGVRHEHDDGSMCNPVSWPRIQENCKCTDPMQHALCNFVCGHCACKIQASQATTSTCNCGACGRPGGVVCWGCGSQYHTRCVAPEHRKRHGGDWLCGLCYQKFARAFCAISNSEAWQQRRKERHVQTQMALVAESRPYGAQPEEVSLFDGEEMQYGKGSDLVEDMLADD